MRKKVINITALIIIFAILFSISALAANSSDDVYSDEGWEYILNFEYEAKIVPGEVVVGLKKNLVVETSYKELFPELKIEKAEKFMEVKGRVWLTVTLVEKAREDVYDAIRLLRNNPYVYVAEPNVLGQYTSSDYPKGDADCDFAISNSDVVTVARYVIGQIELKDIQIKCADMNGDGEVTNSDLVSIAKAVIA